MKKLILTILILLMPVWAFGATYYVDNTCTDTNPASATVDGTEYDPATPACTGGSDSYYVTIADVNAKSFSADDSVLFRKGQTWREQLTVPSSGTSWHPITFWAYGSGDKPIISGADVITTLELTNYDMAPDDCATSLQTEVDATTGWINYGLGTFESATQGSEPNGSYSLHGIVNSNNDGEYFTITTVIGNQYDVNLYYIVTNGDADTQIVINVGSTILGSQDYTSFGRSDTSWTNLHFSFTASATTTYVSVRESNIGDDANYYVDAVKVNPMYTYVKSGVTTEPQIAWYNGTRLTKNDGGLNDLALNEWDWDSDILYVNVGEDPDTGILEIGQRESCIDVNGKNYITIDEFSFTGSQIPTGTWDGGGVNIPETSTGIIVQNSDFDEIFGYGTRMQKCTDCQILTSTYSNIDGNGTHYGDAIIVRNGTDDSSSSNISISEIILSGTFSRSGIVNVGGVDVILDDITATADFPNGTAIDIEPGAGHTCTETIQNSHLLPSSGDAIQISAADVGNVIVKKTTIDLNDGNYTGITVSGISGTAEIYDNEILNIGDNPSVTFSSATVNFFGNLIEGNAESTYGALNVGTGAMVTAYDNLIVDSITAIRTSGVTTAIFYNNDLITFINGFVADNSVGNTSTLKNNIFSSSTLTLNISIPPNAVATTVLNNNLYTSDASEYWRWDGSNYNFTDYKTASSQDANSPTPADPLFTNAAGGQFWLKNNSPACKGGTYLSGYTTKWKWGQTDPTNLITVEDALSIGAYACPKGSALLGF